MAGHDHKAGQPVQPWPGGWLIALIAGIIAAILAKWLGDVTAVTAVLIGIFVFLVFGVLLGMFWDETPASALGENAGGHHGDGHGSHDDHAHAEAGHGDAHGHVATPVAPPHGAAAPPVPTPVMAMPEPVAEPAPAPVAVAASAAAPASAPGPMASSDEPAKPAALSAPRGGKADDLKEIEGIGPALEKLCHELGIFHFEQIAQWGAGEVAWMDSNLKGFKGRVTRDKWVAQAKIIGAEGVAAFRIRAKTNDY